MIRIGVLVYPGVEELDFVGPYETLSYANKIAPQSVDIRLVSDGSGPVRAFNGLRFMPDADFRTCPPLDVLIVPGGKGRVQAMRDQATLNFVRERSGQAGYLGSVCTGAFILAEAGLLEHKRATTHHAALDELRRYPLRVEMSRVVRDGAVFSAAGVSAGLELGFALLKCLFGPDLARGVAKGIEYEVDVEALP